MLPNYVHNFTTKHSLERGEVVLACVNNVEVYPDEKTVLRGAFSKPTLSTVNKFKVSQCQCRSGAFSIIHTKAT